MRRAQARRRAPDPPARADKIRAGRNLRHSAESRDSSRGGARRQAVRLRLHFRLSGSALILPRQSPRGAGRCGRIFFVRLYLSAHTRVPLLLASVKARTHPIQASGPCASKAKGLNFAMNSAGSRRMRSVRAPPSARWAGIAKSLEKQGIFGSAAFAGPLRGGRIALERAASSRLAARSAKTGSSV